MVWLTALLLSGTTPATASAYWDFQGTLHPYPTVRYEYGETNPNVAANWGIRLNRSNCNAKILVKRRSDDEILQVNIPGGCDNSDYTYYYWAQTYYASAGRNKGSSDVWANIRVADTF